MDPFANYEFEVPEVPASEAGKFNDALEKAKTIAQRFNSYPEGYIPATAADANFCNPAGFFSEDVNEKLAQVQSIASKIAQKNNISIERNQHQLEEITDTMLIPTSIVGLVIGKRGETIKHLQDKAMCRMFMVQDGDFARSNEKLLTFQGPRYRVENAKRIIEDFMVDRGYNKPGAQRVELSVPQEAVGLVIGRGGETIKKINTDSNCKVHFNPYEVLPNGERICIFEGEYSDILNAQAMVRDIVETVIIKNGGNIQTVLVREGHQLVQIPVDVERAGWVVGKGGETANEIMEKSGVRLDVNKGLPDETDHKYFLISGSRDQIKMAIRMMKEKAGEDAIYPEMPITNVEIMYTTNENFTLEDLQAGMDNNDSYYDANGNLCWYGDNADTGNGNGVYDATANLPAEGEQQWTEEQYNAYMDAWKKYYEMYNSGEYQIPETGAGENYTETYVENMEDGVN